MKKLFILAFLLLSLSANNVIKIAITNAPNNINPIYNPENDIVKLLYQGLFYKSNNDELIPALISSYKVNENGLEYDFNLLNDIYFMKNGVNYGEFNADDVKFTYDIIKNTTFGSKYQENYQNIKEIKVIDKYKIKFILNHPDDDFLNSLTLGIMSKNAVIKYGLSYFNKDAIGLGAYYLKENDSEEIILIKNQNTNLKAANNGLIFKIYQNDVQIKNALNNKTVDVGIIKYKQVKNISEKITVKTLPSNHTVAIGFSDLTFNDEKLRQAISFVICKKHLVEQLPYFHQVNNPLEKLYSQKLQGCNRTKAKEILNELGYYKDKKSIELDINKENKVNYYKKNDKTLEFNILINHDNDDFKKIGMNIAQQLKDFGILSNIITNKNNAYEGYFEEFEIKDNIDVLKLVRAYDNNLITKIFLAKTSKIKENKENYYKEFLDLYLKNPSYIVLVYYDYFVAHNSNINGIENDTIGINGNGLFSQAIKWYK